MKRLGIVGWRGMVGSVLLERMRAESDFQLVETRFFTTSQTGKPGPDVGAGPAPLLDARDPSAFKDLDIVISCQGGSYTNEMHRALRNDGWGGYWIDAASALRMSPQAAIILDPVNRNEIDRALAKGTLDFIGGNCTVSLMLMAISGLVGKGWVEWINASTYQAASGAGAKNMRELIEQMANLAGAAETTLAEPAASALDLDRVVQEQLGAASFPKAQFGAPLAASLIPWIDSAVEEGQTREEWKGQAETNKILSTSSPIPVDGVCVRVGAMRSHSQALTIKLRQDISLEDIEATIAAANKWVEVIPNTKEATLQHLSPAAVSGTLRVVAGRIRKLKMGPEYLSLFTVGDQLLWGAAEPLRRMLRILLER